MTNPWPICIIPDGSKPTYAFGRPPLARSARTSSSVTISTARRHTRSTLASRLTALRNPALGKYSSGQAHVEHHVEDPRRVGLDPMHRQNARADAGLGGGLIDAPRGPLVFLDGNVLMVVQDARILGGAHGDVEVRLPLEVAHDDAVRDALRRGLAAVPEPRFDGPRAVQSNILLQVCEGDGVDLARDDAPRLPVYRHWDCEVSDPRKQVDDGLAWRDDAPHPDSLRYVPGGEHHAPHVDPVPHPVLDVDRLRHAAPEHLDIRFAPLPSNTTVFHNSLRMKHVPVRLSDPASRLHRTPRELQENHIADSLVSAWNGGCQFRWEEIRNLGDGPGQATSPSNPYSRAHGRERGVGRLRHVP